MSASPPPGEASTDDWCSSIAETQTDMLFSPQRAVNTSYRFKKSDAHHNDRLGLFTELEVSVSNRLPSLHIHAFIVQQTCSVMLLLLYDRHHILHI